MVKKGVAISYQKGHPASWLIPIHMPWSSIIANKNNKSIKARNKCVDKFCILDSFFACWHHIQETFKQNTLELNVYGYFKAQLFFMCTKVRT